MPERIHCNFCGRSNDEAGKLIEKSDRQVANRRVRICGQCAAEAVEALDRELLRREGADWPEQPPGPEHAN